MKNKFRSLFSLTKDEIAQAFRQARLFCSQRGLKILQAPLQLNNESADDNHGKMLVITPKKSGKAHDRNKIKRQLKALFYEEKLYETKSIFIVLVYKNAMSLSFDDIKDIVKKISSPNAGK